MSTMANPLKVGVVGVGHLGRHHARVLASAEGATLVGVADARIEQARAVAGPLNTRPYDDYRELLDKVDAVSIAVPTALHREVAGAFLDRGIPAMVEKPLAATVEEAEALVELARRRGALLQVGHIERFNPAMKALDGLGLRPRFLEADRLSTYTFRSTDVGVVLDLMIHDIDLVLGLVPAPVASVSAVGVSVFGGHEDVADARVAFADGTVAHLTASRASFQPSRMLRVWGAEGYVGLDLAARKATIVRPSEALKRGDLDLDGLDLTQPAAVRERIFGTILEVGHVEGDSREPLALELADFVRCVRNGSRPRVSGEDGLKALAVADAILKSLEAHRWEGLDDGKVPAPGAVPAPHLWRTRTTSRTGTATS